MERLLTVSVLILVGHVHRVELLIRKPDPSAADSGVITTDKIDTFEGRVTYLDVRSVTLNERWPIISRVRGSQLICLPSSENIDSVERQVFRDVHLIRMFDTQQNQIAGGLVF